MDGRRRDNFLLPEITLGRMGMGQTEGGKEVCKEEALKRKRGNKKYIERNDSRQIFSVRESKRTRGKEVGKVIREPSFSTWILLSVRALYMCLLDTIPPQLWQPSSSPALRRHLPYFPAASYLLSWIFLYLLVHAPSHSSEGVRCIADECSACQIVLPSCSIIVVCFNFLKSPENPNQVKLKSSQSHKSKFA